MQKTGTRYLLLCVALISACLAFMQIPAPPPTVVDINGDIESAPNVIHALLFKLQGIAYVGAVSIFMHVICSVLGLNKSSRWLTSIFLPSIVTFAYYLWWVDYARRNEIHFPTSISPSTVFVLEVISFTIGAAVVARLLAFLTPLVEQRQPTSSMESQTTR